MIWWDKSPMGRAKKPPASPGRLGDLSSSSSGSLEGAAGARSTTIVVPCYNEAERLRTDEFLAFARREHDTQLLFVNDGSTDNTAAVLRSMSKRCPDRIEVVDMPVNVGKAEAVRRGMQIGCMSGSRFVGFWDADLATPLDHIAMFKEVMEEKTEVDMVFGARVGLLGRDIRRSMKRHYLGRVFATLASVTLGLGVYDTQCGSKLFRVDDRGDLETVLSVPFHTRWVFDCEMIGRFSALRRSRAAGGFRRRGKVNDGAGDVGGSIYEYPLHRWEDVGGSKVKSSDVLKMAWGLMQVRRRYFWRRWPEDLK